MTDISFFKLFDYCWVVRFLGIDVIKEIDLAMKISKKTHMKCILAKKLLQRACIKHCLYTEYLCHLYVLLSHVHLKTS